MPPKRAPQPKPPQLPAADLEWPQVVSKDYLAPTVFLEDQIILIPDFLSSFECKQIDQLIQNLPLIATPPAKKDEADRVNDRISLQSPAFARSLWEVLGPHVQNIPSFQTHLKPLPKPSSLNSNIRLYRYSPGQYFGPHYDDSIKDSVSKTWSEWTLLVYVTGEEDGVEGGQTVFYKPKSKKQFEEVVPPLTKGMALLHRHGKECMLHEGREVTKGTKLVLRSDLMFSQS